MSEKGRLKYVVSILVVVATAIGLFSTYRQYKAGLREKEQLLYAQVRSLSSLIEAVARFDRGTFRQRDKATAATLSQLFDAFADRIDFDTAQEIQFVRRSGHDIEIFLRYFGRNKNQNIIVPDRKFLPEPVRRAVDGQSGAGYFTGLHGEDVLAAYTYIEPLQIGLIVDLDMWGLQKPYLVSGAVSALFAIALLIIAALAIIRITNPIIARIREKDVLNRTIVETAHDALIILDGEGNVRLANPATRSIFGWEPESLYERYFSVLFPPESKENIQLAAFIRDDAAADLELTEAFGRKTDGSLFPARISANKKEYGHGKWCTLMIQDLSRLRAAERTIRSLSRRLLEIQDIERDQISRDLHDSLGSTLVGLKLQVQSLIAHGPADANDLRQQVVENFNEAIEQTRNLSRLLSPFSVRHLDLGGALKQLAQSLASSREIVINAEIGKKDRVLSPSARIQAYRIAQEAVQNAIKHSGARRITISLVQNGTELVMTIHDDGQGFDTAGAGGGQGLVTMAERAAIIPGVLTVQSAPGNGTEVKLVIP
ncbi:MAG TPA: PAS domain-containing sensor histidine kinase [Turneriella sp.]|nr:PAS domain-containing sensor histidine kinase [Turneriella sp.]